MSKLKYFVFFILSLTASCNKAENKPEDDYKVIETDYFRIKSKYDFGKSQQFFENELPKDITLKDSLKHITLSGGYNEVQMLIMMYDEKFINNEKIFKKTENEFAERFGTEETTIYSDTIINSNEIELSELKMKITNLKKMYLTAKILKEDNCYLITLISEGENYEEDKKGFFEILEGTTIKK